MFTGSGLGFFRVFFFFCSHLFVYEIRAIEIGVTRAANRMFNGNSDWFFFFVFLFVFFVTPFRSTTRFFFNRSARQNNIFICLEHETRLSPLHSRARAFATHSKASTAKVRSFANHNTFYSLPSSHHVRLLWRTALQQRND